MDRNNTIFDAVEMQQEAKERWYFKNQFGLIYQKGYDYSEDLTVEFSWQQKALKTSPKLKVWAIISTDF